MELRKNGVRFTSCAVGGLQAGEASGSGLDHGTEIVSTQGALLL